MNGVDSHKNVVFFTIYTIGQKITSGLRKQHMLPRLVYIALVYSAILFYPGVEAMEIDRINTPSKIKKE